MTPRELRRFLLVIVTALLGVGCIAVYSSTAITSHELTGSSVRYMAHHVAAIGLGVALSLACLRIPYAMMRGSAKIVIGVSVLLLVAVSLCGSQIGGAKRWFRVGRFSVQPSEFAQLALVIYLADFLARKRDVIREFRDGFLPPMLVAGAMAGMVLIQPDLGTAIVMGAVSMLLLVIANARKRHVGGSLLLGALALVVLVCSAEYRRRRILAFVDPWQDPQGVGFQIIQSFLAMANGGMFGQGLGASLQKLFYLPSAHTDFIFAVIGEELGLLGVTAVLALFGLLIGCGLRMAQLTEDLFSKYLIVGCVGLIGLEAIVNMCVVTGMLPTKGLPLPLISYGGTSMVTNLLACALIWYGSRHRRPEIEVEDAATEASA
jgi:cell division protein FtsW